MPDIQESDGRIVIIEKVPVGVRVFICIIGLFPILLAPYELLVRPHWTGFSLSLLLSILMSVCAIAVGGLFQAFGLLGLNQALIFDRSTRMVIYTHESAVIPLRKKAYTFSEIAKLSIITHDWSDGPSTYNLSVEFNNGQKISIGNFKKKAEADQYLTKIINLAGLEGKTAR